MQARLSAVLYPCVLAGMLAGTLLHAQQQGPVRFSGAPREDAGQAIYAAYEGWYQNPDGTYNLLIGYFNRNASEAQDIPIGPDNNIQPGGPDQGQPTHFFPGRAFGLFSIKVPKDFGKQKLVWTLTANGTTASIPVDLDPLYSMTPNSEIGMGNTPPILSFDDGGPTVQGPTPRIESRTAKAGSPMKLDVWVSDDAKTYPGAKPPATPAVAVTWSKYRGPGEVTFDPIAPKVEEIAAKESKAQPFAGKATTTVRFSEPGDYVLNVTLNDWSGAGGRGFLCCWTNGEVKVSVRP
jgi:hypothetical protein